MGIELPPQALITAAFEADGRGEPPPAGFWDPPPGYSYGREKRMGMKEWGPWKLRKLAVPSEGKKDADGS